MSGAKSATRVVGDLRWHQRLSIKLGGIFLVVFLLLGAGAVAVVQLIVRSELLEEVDRYAESDSQRIIAGLDSLILQTEQLANALAVLAANQNFRQIEQAALALVTESPLFAEVHGAGIWAEPYATDRRRNRATLFWLRDDAGQMQRRREYEAEEVIPYYREAWYTPARYATRGNCYWTPVRRELLDNALIMSCSAPIWRGEQFYGVATVQLARTAVRQQFARIANDGLGYALLADRDNQMIGWTDNAAQAFVDPVKPPRNLAELAQNQDAYNQIALTLHGDREQYLAEALDSPLYEATEISALQDATREFSRAHAESALASLWLRPPSGSAQERTVRQDSLDKDPVLRETARIFRSQTVGSHWRLIRALPTESGFAGASYLVNQSLVVTLGSLALTLILVFIGLRYTVLRPLGSMVRSLAGSENPEEAVHQPLEVKRRNELGVLGHWYNERLRQLAEQMERAATTNSLLVMEVDERRKAQRASEAARRRMDAALGMVDQAVIATDPQGRIQEINTAAESLTGTSRDKAMGRPLSEVFQPVLGQDQMPVPNLAQVCVERGVQLDYSHGLKLSSPDGQLLDLNLMVSPVPGDQGKPVGVLVVFRTKRATDSESGAARARSSQRQVDTATGLPSYLACNQRLSHLIETGRIADTRHALIYIDLDQMKAFNDEAGYAAGDELLRFSARTLSAQAPTKDDVYRLSADQFAVIVEGGDVAKASELAELLREACNNSQFAWESRDYQISASFGVTEFGGEDEAAVVVLRRAEAACKQAKLDGRNLVRAFAPGQLDVRRESDDKQWVRRIREGLEENRFNLTTQWLEPQGHNRELGEVYEVLLALEDEEGFWAAPSEFMGVANRQHIASEIDQWVVRSTLHYLSRHPKTVDRLAFCCLNVSTQSLADPGFLHLIVESLQSNPVPPSKLCFEIREDAITEHPAVAEQFCDSLRTVGCRLSIDGFMGRSAADLELLRRLPVDYVKIDTQKFKHLNTDPIHTQLVQSTLTLAKQLEWEVIAAQIEDESQLDAWRRLGAAYLQGYKLAQPTPMIFTGAADT